MASADEIDPPRRVGRYLLYGPIASGGMATVHYGALLGEAGFSRTVAIKRIRADRRSLDLHASLVDEARLVSRVRHPNVVSTLDVLSDESELFLVLEYIAGEALSRIMRRSEEMGQRIPIRYATTLMAGVLHGLHAAHDAKSARNKPLGIVHRDVSPQNVIVGVDGLARVLDFGIAKANERLSNTRHGQLKGKLGYVAPEQLRGEADRRTDIYAAAVVLWEMLTGKRLFWGQTSGDTMSNILEARVPPPSEIAPAVPAELDRIVLRGLERDPERRFESARLFALALEETGIAAASQIGGWVQELAAETLGPRARAVASLERHAAGHAPEAIALPAETSDEPHTREIEDTDATELSQLEMDEPSTVLQPITRDRPTPSRRPWWLAAIALGLLAAAVLLVPPLSAEPPPAAARWITSERWTAASVAPPDPPAAEVPTPSAPAPETAAAPLPPPRPQPPLAKSSCDPPFTVDARGVRRLKPDCL